MDHGILSELHKEDKMKKRLLTALFVSACLAGCGNSNTEESITSLVETTGEQATAEENTSAQKLKSITLDEIKKIVTDDAFDWNTLLTTYEMQNISEENNAKFYSAIVEHNGTSFEFHAQAGVVGGEGTDISLVYLKNESTLKMLQLYSVDDEVISCTAEQIDEFINRQESLEQYLEIEVPRGYVLGTYRAGLEGIFTGCLIYAIGEEEKINPPNAEIHGGVFICKSGDEVIKYNEDGSMYIKASAIDNTLEFVQASDTLDMEDGSQVVYGEGVLEDTKRWYFFVDRKEDEYCYMIYFNENDFKKDEAISIVKTVKYAE